MSRKLLITGKNIVQFCILEKMSETAEEKTEVADIGKIISKLWLLSIKTENIELLIEQSEGLWTAEEKVFLLHLPDRSLKCNAFYSKIIQRDNPTDKINLMKALRFSSNDLIADEIIQTSDSLENANDSMDSENEILFSKSGVSASESDGELENEEDVEPGQKGADERDTENNILSNGMTESFTSIHLEEDGVKKIKPGPVQISYEVNGLTRSKRSKLNFGFQGHSQGHDPDLGLDMGRFLEPKALFISESFQYRITTLKLSDFIINQSHLVEALSPCESIQILELRNVYFDHQHQKPSSLITSHQSWAATSSNKLWLPKLTKFTFLHGNLKDREKNHANNSVYTNEIYSWDQIFFFEMNKGNPAHLRNLWQSQSVDVTVKTLSMELVISQGHSRSQPPPEEPPHRPSVSFILHRLTATNGRPVIPDYFLDSFLRNSRRVEYLNVVLPPELSPGSGNTVVDFDSLPQDLAELTLVGFKLGGAFSIMKPMSKLSLTNCILPEIFLSELSGILPLANNIKLLHCVHENLGIPINVKITATPPPPLSSAASLIPTPDPAPAPASSSSPATLNVATTLTST